MSFATILVPYEVSQAADEVLRLAGRLVQERNGRVIALAMTQIHSTLPLAALLPELDLGAHEALDRAEHIAQQEGFELETRLMHVRRDQIASTILQEAREIPASAIFLPYSAPRWRALSSLLPSVTQIIVRRASCPVLVGPAAGTSTQKPRSYLALLRDSS